ncbi:pentapeptide repeat-containing protein [Candidatus Dependentiae bacterium]
MKKQILLTIIVSSCLFYSYNFSYNYNHLKKINAFIQSDRNDKNLRNLDLTNAPLKNLDLSGGDFLGTDFSRAVLINTKWDNPQYSNVNDGYTNVSFSKFDGARLDRASMKNVLMIHSSIKNAVLNHIKLSEANLEYSNFSNTKLKHCSFYKTKLNETKFNNADLSNSSIIETKLKKIKKKDNVNFTNVTWKNSYTFNYRNTIFSYRITLPKVRTNFDLNQAINLNQAYNDIFKYNVVTGRIIVQNTTSQVEIRDFSNKDLPLPSKIYYDSECAICKEKFEDCEQIAVLPCGHLFHKNCANSALSYSNGICPSCRKTDITGYKTIAYLYQN